MNEIGEVRKLAAIVMLDVVGYSRLVEHDDKATLAALFGHRRGLIEPTVAAHRGRVVNAPGDSTLLEFLSVTNAVRCAIAIQQGMQLRNSMVDPARRIALRIGVNVGDVIVQRGEIFGDGVNVAARLETLAEPGGICLSRNAYEQIRGAIDAAFVGGGLRDVKNLSQPIEIYSLPAHVISALPSIVAPRATPRRRVLAVAALGALLLATGALAALVFGRHDPRDDLQKALGTALAAAQPSATEGSRAKSIASYLATQTHRALVVAPRAQSVWWSGEWSTRAEAEDKSLERCQAAVAESCVVLASDDAATTGAPVGRDMPRAHYAGPFNPYWIPGVRASTAKRGDVGGYLGAPAPKAMAYHVRGLVFVATAASSQFEAETQALKMCNSEGARRESEAPCLLYAAADLVVFSERRTTPRAAR